MAIPTAAERLEAVRRFQATLINGSSLVLDVAEQSARDAEMIAAQSARIQLEATLTTRARVAAEDFRRDRDAAREAEARVADERDVADDDAAKARMERDQAQAYVERLIAERDAAMSMSESRRVEVEALKANLNQAQATAADRLHFVGVASAERNQAQAERDAALMNQEEGQEVWADQRGTLIAERDGARQAAEVWARAAADRGAERDALRAELELVKSDTAAWTAGVEEGGNILRASLATARAERDAAKSEATLWHAHHREVVLMLGGMQEFTAEQRRKIEQQEAELAELRRDVEPTAEGDGEPEASGPSAAFLADVACVMSKLRDSCGSDHWAYQALNVAMDDEAGRVAEG